MTVTVAAAARGRPGRERYRAQAAAALDAVRVRPPATVLWFGARVALARAGDAPARDVLVTVVSERLRADFYGDGVPRPRHAGPVTPGDDGGGFARALSHANCGRGSWQAGWRVTGVQEDDAVAVQRPDGLRLLAPADRCRVDGDRAEVRVPKERGGLAPGCYVALGDTPAPAAGADAAVRLHWNVAAAGAVTFVARATYALNGAGMPFRLELLDNPARYGRRPPAALVLARADVAPALKLLRPLRRTLGPYLGEAAPAFTKPLARGLALAEEPAGGVSFGAHRCRLLAEAIVGASERGLRLDGERLALVDETFGAAGISLDAPYLEPGGDDAYDLP